MEVLRVRAMLFRRLRSFFAERGVMEVDTPICSAHGSTDPAIESLRTLYTGPGAVTGRTLYLQTSPEFAMKRLLSAGSGPIYQICKVFRDGERGAWHMPEFTLLEWYRPGFDHHRLMREVEDLMCLALDRKVPARHCTYGEIFLDRLSVNPHRASIDELRQCASRRGIGGVDSLELRNRDAWLDLLLSHCIVPSLPQEEMTFIYDYPASQASLSRVTDENPSVAQRFELYMGETELANGFHELTDGAEQRGRFVRDLKLRCDAQQPEVPIDENLLAALNAGMPACAGVALGVDRLLMKMVKADRIDRVLAFPIERA